MTLEELQKLVDIAVKAGVREITYEGVHLVFGAPIPSPAIEPAKKKDKERKKGARSDYARFLFAATEGYEVQDDEELGAPLLPVPPRIEVKQ